MEWKRGLTSVSELHNQLCLLLEYIFSGRLNWIPISLSWNHCFVFAEATWSAAHTRSIKAKRSKNELRPQVPLRAFDRTEWLGRLKNTGTTYFIFSILWNLPEIPQSIRSSPCSCLRRRCSIQHYIFATSSSGSIWSVWRTLRKQICMMHEPQPIAIMSLCSSSFERLLICT